MLSGGFRWREIGFILERGYQIEGFEKLIDEVLSLLSFFVFNEKKNMGTTIIGAAQINPRMVRVGGTRRCVFVPGVVMCDSE